MSPSGTLKKCQKYLLPYRSKFDRRFQWKHTNCKNVHVSRNRKMLVKMYFTRFEAGFFKSIEISRFSQKVEIVSKIFISRFLSILSEKFQSEKF